MRLQKFGKNLFLILSLASSGFTCSKYFAYVVSPMFVCLVGFLMSSPATRLYSGRVQRPASDNFTCCHTRDRSRQTMTSLSASHIIMTPTQPVGSGWPHLCLRALCHAPPLSHGCESEAERPSPHSVSARSSCDAGSAPAPQSGAAW